MSTHGDSQGQAQTSPSTTDDARAQAREALLATFALLALLAVLKPLGNVIPGGQEVVFFVAIAFQLYVPVVLLQRRGQTPEAIGIYVHGVVLGPLAALRRRRVQAQRRRPRQQRGKIQTERALWLASWARGASVNGPAARRELVRVAVLAAFFFPLFAVGMHLWQALTSGPAAFRFRLPDDIVQLVIVNIALVAVAEEVFYRGYLERKLDGIWPSQRAFLGIPLTRTVWVASALFALGHFLGEWNPARLGPFFPALVFSGLTRQGGSLLGAILFHGLSNVFSAILVAGYVGS